MTQVISTTISRAQKAVARLVDACSKGGALYVQNPKAVAQVSRTGKWLLNAINGLSQDPAASRHNGVS